MPEITRLIHQRSALFVLVLLAISAAITAALVLGPTVNETSAPVDQQQLALGEEIYLDYCAACHGAELEGQENWQRRDEDGYLPAPPHDETGHTWHHPDAQLIAIIRDGIAPFAPEGYNTTMTGFGDLLSDEEIVAVLEYIKAQWPEEIRTRQAEITRQHREVRD